MKNTFTPIGSYFSLISFLAATVPFCESELGSATARFALRHTRSHPSESRLTLAS
jgi:hypothetical protein